MHSSCMNYWKENGERFVPTKDFPTPDSITPGSKGFTRNGPSEEEKVAVSLGTNNGGSGRKCSNKRSTKGCNSQHTKSAKRLCQKRQLYTDVKKRTSARNKSNTSPQKKKTKKEWNDDNNGPDVGKRTSDRNTTKTFAQKLETTYKKDCNGCQHDDPDQWEKTEDLSFYLHPKKRRERFNNNVCLTHCIECKQTILPAHILEAWLAEA